MAVGALHMIFRKADDVFRLHPGGEQAARRIQGPRIFEDDAALAAIERWTKVTPDAVRRSTPSYFALNGQVHVETLMDAQRYFIQSGSTTYREPLTIEQLHDDRYVQAALAEIGVVPE